MPDRARSYRTEGIILRRRNIGEADTIFTVFSPSLGKFEGVARGVRKARSHMRGHLEPLTRSELMLARGRSLDVFTQAVTIDPYRRLHDDLERSALGMYCCELISRFANENIAQRDVYALLRDVLAALDDEAPAHVVRYFEQQLLELTGYQIQLYLCASCQRPLPEDETLFSASAGGLVCAACRPQAGAGRLLPVRAIKVLRFGATATLSEFAALRLDELLQHQLEQALGDAVRNVLDREPASARYIVQLPRRPE